MLDDKEFYSSKNIEKYPPDGKMKTCKKCLTMHVDNWDPETFTWILQEIDVPYIKEEWDSLLEKYGTDPKKITGLTIIGRYLSKMKLKQWSKYTWADTDPLAEKALQEKVFQMQAQGLTGEEIEEQLSMDRTPPKPKGLKNPQEQTAYAAPEYVDIGEEDTELSNQLTEEDKLMLRLKWGRAYRPDEWVRMEKLYQDMMNSYDIQGAGHKDTLVMICKASLKANQLIDAGDIEGFQKLSKVYDALMKSGKFTAAQNKEAEEQGIDSIGQLVAICEKDSFIPKYYVDKPQDKVDRVLQDMQEYTHDLVTDELGLGNLIENSLKALEREKEAIAAAAEMDETRQEQQEEDRLFDYADEQLTDQDFIDIQKEMEEDESTESP